MINKQINGKLARLKWLEERFRLADCFIQQERYLREATRKREEIEELREMLNDINEPDPC